MKLPTLNTPSCLLLALSALAPTALCQTEVLFSFDRPSVIDSGWGTSQGILMDVNGDGVEDLFVGTDRHGGGTVASVHSGKTGDLLYFLEVPFGPMFSGQAIVSVSDQSGDGVPELLVFASQSGASNSPPGTMTVHSGVDGSVLHSHAAPAGFVFNTRFFEGVLVIDDLDGDGSEDVLVRTRRLPSAEGLSWTALSSATGNVLFVATRPGVDNYLFAHSATVVSDHNDDGIVDFAHATNTGGTTHFQLRSGSTGAVLGEFPLAGAPLITSNGEPFRSIPDLDGDGKRDLAVGGVFFGFVGIYSSADGSTIQSWDCSTQSVPCMGSRIIALPSSDRGAGVDLLTIESNFGTPDIPRLIGLDPLTGKVEFEQSVPDIIINYTQADRISTIRDIDDHGFATFAIFDESSGRMNMRRVALEVGRPECAGDAGTAAQPLNLRALGSAALSGSGVLLEIKKAPTNSPVMFLAGSQASPLSFAGTTLCIGGNLARLGVQQSDSIGGASLEIDLSMFGHHSPNWTFQAISRDSQNPGIITSNGTTVSVQR